MNTKTKINHNLAKINTLRIDSYEKEVIRSAYLNHINNIPLAPHAAKILTKHSITFRFGSLSINNKIEERKKHYKRRTQDTNNISQQDNVYERNYLNNNQTKNQSQALLNLLQHATNLYKDTNNLLIQCKELLNINFKKDELSYGMIANIIAKLEQNAQDNKEAFEKFLEPFNNLFDSLQIQSQQQILTKSNTFLKRMQDTKDTSADLCIKLSLIRAQNTFSKENDFIAYLNHTIKQLDAYLK